MDGKFPWGTKPPKKPRPGSGRAALKKRAKAKGGGERKRSPAAARRALRKRGGRRAKGGGRIRGAAAELRRVSRLVEQKLPSRQRLRHLLLALAGVWAIWTFALGGASLPKLWSTKRQNANLGARIEELQAHDAGLRDEVKSLSDPKDTQALENLARDQHGLVRDGETLVRFYEEDE